MAGDNFLCEKVLCKHGGTPHMIGGGDDYDAFAVWEMLFYNLG